MRWPSASTILGMDGWPEVAILQLIMNIEEEGNAHSLRNIPHRDQIKTMRNGMDGANAALGDELAQTDLESRFEDAVER